jgi:hypothetical protein
VVSCRRNGMDSDEEFNHFVMNEVIDPSSSDDDNDLFFGAAHIIVDDLVNHPGRIGSVVGHDVVDRERLLHHTLLYKDYFSANPTFKSKTFRRRFACFIYLFSNLNLM